MLGLPGPFAGAAVTRDHVLKQQKETASGLEARGLGLGVSDGGSRQGFWRIWSRPLSYLPAFAGDLRQSAWPTEASPRCLPSPLPAVPQRLCVQFSSSYRDAGRSGFDSTPMTPLHRDSFCKGPVSEEGRVLTGCGQDCSISFWRTQFNREQPPRLLWSRSLEASADSAAADQWWGRECGRGPPAWSLVAAPFGLPPGAAAESCQSQHRGEQPARARPQLRKSYSVPSLASEGQNSHPHPLGLEGEDGDARVNGKGVEATCAMGTRLQPSLGDTRGQRDRALKRHRAWPGGDGYLPDRQRNGAPGSGTSQEACGGASAETWKGRAAVEATRAGVEEVSAEAPARAKARSGENAAPSAGNWQPAGRAFSQPLQPPPKVPAPRMKTVNTRGRLPFTLLTRTRKRPPCRSWDPRSGRMVLFQPRSGT